MVHSHWSRSNEARLSLVESFILLLRQCLLCHKEPARRIQSPLLGAFCLLLAGSLWHKGAYNRTFPCMEANYPYAIKNQRGASKVGGFGCDELVLYGIRDTGGATLWSSLPMRAEPRWASTNESGPHCSWLPVVLLHSGTPNSPWWGDPKVSKCLQNGAFLLVGSDKILCSDWLVSAFTSMLRFQEGWETCNQFLQIRWTI